MEPWAWGILNTFICVCFLVYSINKGIKPYGAIPNGLFAIVLFAYAAL